MDLLKELANPAAYQPVFAALVEKAREKPYRLSTSPVAKGLSLDWVLHNEREVVADLIGEIRTQRYRPLPCCAHDIKLDKERRLYSMSWPDRIFEAALARLIAALVEPHLSPRLYSFRRGRGNHMAVASFAQYLRAQTAAGLPVYIAKRDVARYGESIQVEKLLVMLRGVLGPQDKYLWALVDDFLRPMFRDSGDAQAERLTSGLPAGFALVPVCENLYLTPLDRLCDGGDAFYCRFGDDILFAHHEENVLLAHAEKMEGAAAELGLTFKPDKRANAVLRRGEAPSALPEIPACDFLGYSVNSAGETFLSRRKLRQFQQDLQRTVRRSFHANRPAPSAELMQAAVHSINLYFAKELEHPYLPLLLRQITDLRRLKQLDTWIAKLTVRRICRTGHDRVFRRVPLADIRRSGLISLVHLRNIVRRRQ